MTEQTVMARDDGVYWASAEVVLRQGVGFLVAIALARLLLPADFGLVALVSLFTGLAMVLADAGLSAALVQRRDTTHAEENSVFWVNLGAGMLAACVLAASAPLVARLYGQPIVEPMMTVLAANVVIGSAGAIHSTLLAKKLAFRTLFLVTLVATVASCSLAVALAASGLGVWSLVAQALAMTSVTTVLLWIVHRWRPMASFDVSAARSLFGFGGYLLAASLLDVAYTRAYTVFLGLFHGVRELGYFNRADVLRQAPLGIVGGILNRMALPTFARVAGDRAELRRQLRKAVRGAMLFCAPAALGLAAIAEPAVAVLLGPGWGPVAPILQVLCLGAVLWPLQALNLHVLMALGMSRHFFHLELAKKGIGIGLVGLGSAFGVLGIAWGTVAASLVAFFINTHQTGRLLEYGPIRQLCDALPAISAGGAMGAAVWFLGQAWSLPPVLELAGLIGAGVALYGALYRLVGLTRRTVRDSPVQITDASKTPND